jgi:hypothetical protein
MKSKIVVRIMSLAMVIGLTFTGTGFAANTVSAKGVFARGDGTKANPYQITYKREKGVSDNIEAIKYNK